MNDKIEEQIKHIKEEHSTMGIGYHLDLLSTLIQEERNLEEWKTIVGFPKYQISNKGRVKNEQKILKLGKGGKSGDYPYIILTNGKEKRTFRIHKLVALYFVPNPLGAGTVNHKDLNKDNNNAENLEWVTIRENINHGWDNGAYNTDRVRKSQDENIHKASKALRKEVAQYTTDGEFVKSYVSVSEASRETGIPFRNISAVTKGRQKTCHGYLWKYLESEGVKSNEKDDTPKMLDRTTDSFEYYYWCYDFGDGDVAYKNSVEFIVIADNEHAALKKAGEIVKRDIYKLISVDKR